MKTFKKPKTNFFALYNKNIQSAHTVEFTMKSNNTVDIATWYNAPMGVTSELHIDIKDARQHYKELLTQGYTTNHD